MLLNELRDLVSKNSAPDIEVHGVDPSIYLIFSCKTGSRRPSRTAEATTSPFAAEVELWTL